MKHHVTIGVKEFHGVFS